MTPIKTIAPLLRDIGRGRDGARALSIESARELMAALLDGAVTDLEVGAFAIGMRMKGETLAELVGFVQALHDRLHTVPSDRPVVVIPSYNGARRLPNLVPLLAGLLARDGVRVLVHGPLHDPGRVTTAEVMAALGHVACDTASAVHRAWSDAQPAFMPVGALLAGLERLLQVRRTIGLRNSGHTIAKMMLPVSGAPALRLMSHTHPEFGQLMSHFAENQRAHVMLLRGTEGEAVADARRLPRLAVWLQGQARPDLGSEPTEGTLAALPELPREIDAPSTARWIGDALAGRVPVPAPIDVQRRCIERALAELAATPLADAASA